MNKVPNYFTQRGLERHRQLIAKLEARLSELEALVGGTAETGGGWIITNLKYLFFSV